MISLEGVHKSYGSNRVLTGVDLTVESGDIVGLLGPNGAGKTTLTRVLLGLERPDQGRVGLLGADPRSDPSVRSRVGYAPELAPFDEDVCGFDALAGFARLMGVPRERARTRAGDLLETVGIAEAAQQDVAEYSKGMRQRLNLARALVHEPELAILDEPTSGLDPNGKAEIRDLIRSLSSQGTTVLLSTHEMPSVTETNALPVILSNGRLHRQTRAEDPQELVAAYEEVTTRGDRVVFVPQARS